MTHKVSFKLLHRCIHLHAHGTPYMFHKCQKFTHTCAYGKNLKFIPSMSFKLYILIINVDNSYIFYFNCIFFILYPFCPLLRNTYCIRIYTSVKRNEQKNQHLLEWERTVLSLLGGPSFL